MTAVASSCGRSRRKSSRSSPHRADRRGHRARQRGAAALRENPLLGRRPWPPACTSSGSWPGPRSRRGGRAHRGLPRRLAAGPVRFGLLDAGQRARAGAAARAAPPPTAFRCAGRGCPGAARNGWLLVVLFVFQSVIFYGLIAWIVPYLGEHGWSGTAAGSRGRLPGAARPAECPLHPFVGDRIPRGWPSAGRRGCALVGVAGFAAVPDLAWIWAACRPFAGAASSRWP